MTDARLDNLFPSRSGGIGGRPPVPPFFCMRNSNRLLNCAAGVLGPLFKSVNLSFFQTRLPVLASLPTNSLTDRSVSMKRSRNGAVEVSLGILWEAARDGVARKNQPRYDRKRRFCRQELPRAFQQGSLQR